MSQFIYLVLLLFVLAPVQGLCEDGRKEADEDLGNLRLVVQLGRLGKIEKIAISLDGRLVG